MKWISKYKHPESLKFEITLDKAAGFYLNVWDKDGKNFYDDLQDTLDWAKDTALEEFGVPMDSWSQVEENGTA